MGKKGCKGGCAGGCMKCGGHIRKYNEGGPLSGSYGNVIDAQKAYDDEVARVKQVRKNVLTQADKMLESNIGPMGIGDVRGYNYCNAYTNTCYNLAGATTAEDITFKDYWGPGKDRYIPSGSPHPQIAGNLAEQSVLDEEGFVRIPLTQLEPGDRIKKEIYTDKVPWQEKGTARPSWKPGHSAIFAGYSKGIPQAIESGGDYYDYHKGSWKYPWTENPSVEGYEGGYGPERTVGYRYVGKTPKLKKQMEEAKASYEKYRNNPKKMPTKEIKILEKEMENPALAPYKKQEYAEVLADSGKSKKFKFKLKQGGMIPQYNYGGIPYYNEMGSSGMYPRRMQIGGLTAPVTMPQVTLPQVNIPQMNPMVDPVMAQDSLAGTDPYGEISTSPEPQIGAATTGQPYSMSIIDRYRAMRDKAEADLKAREGFKDSALNPNVNAEQRMTQQSMFAPRSEFMYRRGGSLPQYKGGVAWSDPGTWESIANIGATLLPFLGRNRRGKRRDKETGETDAYKAAQEGYLRNKANMERQQQMLMEYAMMGPGRGMQYGPRGGVYGGSTFGGYSPQIAGSYGQTYY